MTYEQIIEEAATHYAIAEYYIAKRTSDKDAGRKRASAIDRTVTLMDEAFQVFGIPYSNIHADIRAAAGL